MNATTTRCPHCGAVTHMTIYGDCHSYRQMPLNVMTDVYRYSAAFTCDACHRMAIATFVSTLAPRSIADVQGMFDEVSNLQWEPVLAVGRTFEHVPEHIASAASEAYACHSIRAYRAAGAMARAVVEATAKEKGITSGVLHTKIEAMKDQDLIRPHIADAAHEVRHLGNDVAHGDFVEPVTAEEAEEILTLMSEVLDEVFTSPARIQAVQAARLAKKAADSAATSD